MVVIQHAFIYITVAVLLLLNNFLDYLWSRLLDIHNFLWLRGWSNNWLRLRLGWAWFRDRSFSLDLNLDLFLLGFRAQINGMPGQEPIPVVIFAVLITKEALYIEGVPIATPVVATTPRSVLTNHSHRA